MKRELPLTTAALASLAAILVVAVVGYFGLVWPAQRELTRLQSALTAASAQAAGAAVTALPISDVERASWQTVETRVRERFIPSEEQYRLLVEVAQTARASGLAVSDVQLEGAATAPTGQAGQLPVIALPLTPPPNLAINPGVIRLSAQHRYRALIDFLDRLGTANTYVALQAIDVRRVGDLLQSDIRLVSLRWVQTP
jgi:hypothetical protein